MKKPAKKKQLPPATDKPRPDSPASDLVAEEELDRVRAKIHETYGKLFRKLAK